MALSKKAFGVKDHVADICDEIVYQFPKIPNVWGYALFPDHNNRKCVDYMCSTSVGNDIADYHIENARRLDVEFMVWRGRAWRAEANQNGPRGWGKYHDPDSHFDHVHVQYGSNGKAKDWLDMTTAKEVAEEVLTRDGHIENIFNPESPNKEVSLATAIEALGRRVVYQGDRLRTIDDKLDKLLAELASKTA